jgi:imidazolonepropionase-like amidohydrolase
MKVFTLLLLWAVPPSVLAQPHKPQPMPVAITHVTVIDATGAPARPDMTVVIVGDRITELDPANKARVPKNARVVDATGKFLIPGLWDMHVHWGFDKEYLPLFIANGVTGIRLMAGQPSYQQWRKEIGDGTLLGPRMGIASTIVDGPKPWWPNSIAVSSDAEARQAVNKVKQDGADFVKVYWLLPRDAYFAIADEAKKQGIPFAGHVPFAVSAAEASDAGQKSIEHLEGFAEACSTREEELLKATKEAWLEAHSDPRGPHPPTIARMHELMRMAFETFSPEKAAALFARLKRNHTWECPTLRLYRGLTSDPKTSQNDPRLKYLPPDLRTRWFGNADAASKEQTAEDIELGKAVFKRTLEIVGMMRRAGIEFLAGTDVPVPYGFPGFTLHDELAVLVQAGFTPMEALQAATRNPARFLDKDKDLGTIEKGKIADLVLMDANPLQDISNTQKIEAVVFAGRLIPRSELAESLAKVEALANKK